MLKHFWKIVAILMIGLNTLLITNANFMMNFSGLFAHLAPSLMTDSLYKSYKNKSTSLTKLQTKNNNLMTKHAVLNHHANSLDIKNNKLTSTNNRLKANYAKAQKTITKRSRRVARRIKKVVISGMARAPVEAIPFVGLPVLVGGIAYEFSMGCQNLNDINQMLLSVGSEPQEGITQKVCQAKIPTLDDFKAMIN